MAALVELVAERGYAAATIGELAARAGVSRAAFYEHFEDKEACLLAAYDHWSGILLTAMAADVDPNAEWTQFIDSMLSGYLGGLEADPVAARAFIVQMDAAGPAARSRRRATWHTFAAVVAQRHAEMRERDPALGPLPERVFLGLVYAVRELVHDALEAEPAPSLRALGSDIQIWIAATVAGAGSTA
jgi:AcrR family transcriptional regulator